MNEHDLTRIHHMLDYGKEVIQFTEGQTRASLDENLMLLRALCMSIGVIGEAASKISQETRDSASEIPWREVIGMRNFVFHIYHRVEKDIVGNSNTGSTRTGF